MQTTGNKLAHDSGDGSDDALDALNALDESNEPVMQLMSGLENMRFITCHPSGCDTHPLSVLPTRNHPDS
jgi:hypothetical protein